MRKILHLKSTGSSIGSQSDPSFESSVESDFSGFDGDDLPITDRRRVIKSLWAMYDETFKGHMKKSS